MSLLQSLLYADASSPRLTVYNSSSSARLDFSATTLDNWACKVGNMLIEEFDLEAGDKIAIDLPVGWQPVVIALGALSARCEFMIGAPDGDSSVAFVRPGMDLGDFDGAVALVTDDAFGRGVAETGGVVPAGMVDFGPTVRAYGDQFGYPCPTLDEVVRQEFAPGARVMSTGWSDVESFSRAVLCPLASGGSAVVVSGIDDAAVVERISREEKVDLIV